MAKKTPFALLFLFFFFPSFTHPQNLNFTFNGFNESETSLTLNGATILKPTGALRLTNQTTNTQGHVFYSKPIQMLQQNSSNASSFSTNFVFAIVTPSSGEGGYGLAFTLSPSPDFSGAETGQYMGIYNSSNEGKPYNHVFLVEFDTVKGFDQKSEEEANHVAIGINGVLSKELEPASYYSTDRGIKKEMDLDSGDPIQAWIEYDGVQKKVNVTIFPINITKPNIPLISFDIDLTSVVKETMYVGFSASTGQKRTSSHYILGWSFSTNGTAVPLDTDQLPPLPPIEKNSPVTDPKIIALTAALAVVIVILFGMLIFFTCCKRTVKFHEDLEDWELDCPHRFQYRDLYTATKGFKDSERIGIGGFGTVFRGVLPTTGAEVAVKRITRNSIQGMREFAAEIESLGRLRQKNLVNLQGWCKKKNDLLLIYDYIPYGSLYSLLFEPRNGFVLSWEQRFIIIKGIASGLLYLHEEWEKVVIHRDVKSSNVLIDADLNARLGDFGLARLYDHGTMSHTTQVVGTIGYIAPELARNGRASTSSDVFAYGVLLLEVATGRKPTDRSSNFLLVDWVIEYQQMGAIVDTVDPKLGSDYAFDEVNLVLQLGLLCTHQKPEFRPRMRQVLRYLNGDDRLPSPSIQSWGSYDSREEVYSRFLEGISSDTIKRTPCRSSSFSCFSLSSLETAR
ncbi:hypothetical protein SLEP1_g31960 [Rubroshorea leprosula]|uniref:non-specific serine/threonine protein kinase n=1 Tax=Rubroshorea leprosula TaxID=152421 RepID=A0AAV5KBZ5_9ROSI|nr:hypothetical protein SLEP1_g31960 [Rubroshorea leprosula]